MNCSTPSRPVHHQILEFTQIMSIELVMPSSHLILCRPLLLLPSIFPSIRVFSNESALCMTWPEYWSFSFNISPSNEHSGLISFRMDWLDWLNMLSRLFITYLPRSQFFTSSGQSTGVSALASVLLMNIQGIQVAKGSLGGF